MSDAEWFAWCFSVWRGRAPFVLDTERSAVDMADRIPPEGWVP